MLPSLVPFLLCVILALTGNRMDQLKADAVRYAILAAVVIGAAWYAKKKIGNIGFYVPEAVSEGTEAGYLLLTEAVDAVLHPLDAFGISPKVDEKGQTAWEKTVPWNEPADPMVTDSGMDMRYF